MGRCREQRRVESAVDAFLAAHPDLRPELVQYARSARSGCVEWASAGPLASR
jgi:hypothetical protein